MDSRIAIRCRPVAGLEKNAGLFNKWNPAKLVLTSPPYPGVHVVYNRWQILGRKETATPYWIIGSEDGRGLSHYALGDRKEPGLKKYFQNLKESFSTVHKFMNKKSRMLQIVGFSDPSWQMQKYLQIMDDIGFSEIRFNEEIDVPYSRVVPNRKWYAQHTNQNGGSSKEFLLFFKIKK
ncbi:MAG: hypothetical protein JW699_08375 [Chitinispirillaceae bacterium]|nr:hypothetical protein [Chitinispirillaceae bacterium]